MKLIAYGVTDKEKADTEAYAKEKGLKDASALARFAVARYMAQYPPRASLAKNGHKSSQGVPHTPEEGIPEGYPC